MEAYTSAEFEELFRKHFKYLCIVAYQCLNDRDLAEDIVQEFYINFWERRENININTTFRSYASRAVKNRSIDEVRKQHKGENHNQELGVEETYDPQVESEEQAQHHQRQLQVIEMVESLPEQRRRILIMHAVERLSYQQIADKQNISINTVRTQLSRAYATLRNITITVIILLTTIFYFPVKQVVMEFTKNNLTQLSH